MKSFKTIEQLDVSYSVVWLIWQFQSLGFGIGNRNASFQVERKVSNLRYELLYLQYIVRNYYLSV